MVKLTPIIGNRNALKGLGVGIALSMFSQFTANFTIISYAVTLFQKTGTAIDPYKSSFVLAIALIFGSLATTYLVERLGRKVLNFISLLGSGLGLFTTSFYHYLNLNGLDVSGFEWIPVTSLSFVIFLSSAGILPLVMICTVEYMPAKVFIHARIYSILHWIFIVFYFS